VTIKAKRLSVPKAPHHVGGDDEKERSKKMSTAESLLFAVDYYKNLLTDTHNDLRMLYGFADYTRDCALLDNRIKNEGLAFLVDVLPTLMQEFLEHLEGNDVSFPHFKKDRGKNYPRFLRRLFEITQNERHSAEVQARALHTIYCVSVAFKKLLGQPDDVTQLKHYADFVSVEDELRDIDIKNPELSDILESARSQWSVFAHDINIDERECIPRPGPGAVVGQIQKHMRYAPHVYYKQLANIFPYEDWFFSHPWDVNEQSRKYIDLLSQQVTEPYSEYLLVPKTYRKWRGICKETNEAQFLQQAVRRLLKKHIQSKLGDYLPLEDQNVHAMRALSASMTRDDATIDESEASDRILRDLVSYISQDSDLHDVLMALSTRTIKSPSWARKTHKKFLRTLKFAPMGSAICFPVMSLTHLFLIKAIIRKKMIDIPCTAREALCERVSVYGDDIVLPSLAVPYVYEWLPKFGMKINRKKSFVNSHFRESCGCHAYKGIDITPLYFKHTNVVPTGNNLLPKQLVSLLAVENQCYARGFLRTGAFLRGAIQAKWNFHLPYVGEFSPVVGFKRPPNSPQLTVFRNNKRRWRSIWNRGLQSYSFRLPIFSVKTDKGVIPTSEQAYLRYQCVKPSNSISYELRGGGPKPNSLNADMVEGGSVFTPFSMADAVHAVVDESQDIRISWERMPESSVYQPEKDWITGI